MSRTVPATSSAEPHRSFTGTQTVAFGTGSSFTEKSLTAGTPCTDAVFGDPDYGVVKACFRVSSG
jgi:alpha-L-rhamnosidase